MTVTSLNNIRGSKSLVVEQQDEEDNSTANAVSFPASVLKQNSSTGKGWKQLLDLRMITTTALSKKRPTERRHCVSALYGSYLKELTDAHLSMVHGLYNQLYKYLS